MSKEKADIWMPLYIGDYLSATTHLSAEESGGYLHLLMHAWKNGSLPSDMEGLRRIARIDKDAWSNAWAMLQPFFDMSSGGAPVQKNLERIRNEWNDKKVASTEKARVAAEARWNKNAPSNAPSIPPSNAQAMPQRCPSSSPSSIEEQQQKPSRGKREVDPRFSEFRGACESYYKYKTLPMTWDGSESKQLSSLLTANPSLSLDRFQDILRNRLKSTVNHAERPRSWLSRATEYLAGPLDKYGKPLEIDGGNRGTHQSNQSRGANRVEQQLEELRKAGVSIPPGRAEAGPKQDVPVAGRGDGFDSPGVVLEGVR